ncbi:MAG: DUF3969 family protein [Alkalinema sp. RU_4_3]|nr:DUF3969 family protein [Alkalinema sp. RU_4_3]
MTITSMLLMFKLNDRSDVSELVAVMSLGLCTAIAGGSVSIEEAERRLFNPKVLAQLTGLGLSESLLEIVHLGTELEDVQSLVPERLSESLAQMQAKSLAFLNQTMNRSNIAA